MGQAAIPLAIASTVLSINQQQKAASQQRKAQKAQERIAQARNRQARRKQARELAIAQSTAISQSVAQGASPVGLPSGTLGDVSSGASQVGSNLGFGAGIEQLGGDVSIFNQRAADAQNRAAIFQSAANISSLFIK